MARQKGRKRRKRRSSVRKLAIEKVKAEVIDLFRSMTKAHWKMKVPKMLKITGRTSSVTNAFAQSILPSIAPTPEEKSKALEILGMTAEDLSCVYCGNIATDWDHLRPLVCNKLPTGYISEVRNMVPSCGPCNQSKGGQDWRTWICSAAKRSPRSRGVSDLDQRIARLDRFEKWADVQKLPLPELCGAELWETHWANCSAIAAKMKEAQEHAERLKKAIQDAYNLRRASGGR